MKYVILDPVFSMKLANRTRNTGTRILDTGRSFLEFDAVKT